MRGIPANAEVIRRLRKHRLWSQEKLAAKAGCSVRTIRNAEQGSSVDPGTLRRISQALETSVAALAAVERERDSEEERRLQFVADWCESYIACDVGRQLEFYHSQTKLISIANDIPGGGAYQGVKQLATHLEFMFDTFPVIRGNGDQALFQVGERLFHRSSPTMMCMGTGQEFTATGLNEFWVRDGKVLSRSVYVDCGAFRDSMIGGAITNKGTT